MLLSALKEIVSTASRLTYARHFDSPPFFFSFTFLFPKPVFLAEEFNSLSYRYIKPAGPVNSPDMAELFFSMVPLNLAKKLAFHQALFCQTNKDPCS